MQNTMLIQLVFSKMCVIGASKCAQAELLFQKFSKRGPPDSHLNWDRGFSIFLDPLVAREGAAAK